MSSGYKEIFISFAIEREGFAREICNKIEKRGTSCFFAPRDIHAGREYARELVDGIDHAKGLVLLMSKGANESPHVLREVERAVRKKVPILMYRLEDVTLSKSMEYFLMTHQWVNAGAEGEKALMSFVDECKRAPHREDAGEENDTDDFKEKQSTGKEKGGANFLHTGKGAVLLTIITIFLVIGAFLAVDFGFDLGIVFGKEAVKESAVEYALGDTIVFGTYQGEPIRWRILKISEGGDQAVVVSEEIISMKAFDAAASGQFNRNADGEYWHQNSEADRDVKLQAEVRGNNSWELSNIRTWLNATEETVVYENGVPADTAMSEVCNGYEYEPGFLHEFSEAELARIIETRVVTEGNVLSEEDTVTLDKVFLLSKEELEWFRDAGIHMVAKPRETAVAADESNWYQHYSLDYGVEYYYWWLRTPVEGSASECYMVTNGYTSEEVMVNTVGLEGYGIRPAMTIILE